MKLAMLNVFSAMEREGMRGQLLLQVHDELIFEVPKQEIHAMQLLVKREMEGAYRLSVPLRVSLEVGLSWGEMH